MKENYPKGRSVQSVIDDAFALIGMLAEALDQLQLEVAELKGKGDS